MGKRVKDQTFGFDRVFDENTSQAEVYECTARGLLDSVLDGYNATVFAYGATGCGKTHTITGTAQQPGIIFLTMQELFEKIAERSDEKQTEVSLSYLEIYNETIRDLLVPGGSKQGLMLREDANQAVSVSGLSSHHPRDVHQVMDMIVTGNEYRTVSPTAANATSSRSHAVLQINVAQKDRNADVNEPHTMATLSIIDLAGSERASATKNRGDRLLEGANINKSLLALGSCINALCDPRKRNHVPYRNSKLTRLLKFSLGGNCKTVMIVCVSPSSAHFDETQNTLRYANRAKNIQTKVTRNVYNVNRHVKDFLVKIDEQMNLINELKAQQKDSEAAAFIKFKKQNEKRESIAREGLLRIRAAYDHSLGERTDKVNNTKKLRKIERRIHLISSWIGAFEEVCATHKDSMAPNLVAMRKTAGGILIELENSRQHYHQLIKKTNWQRAIDSACKNSIRMLEEVDVFSDGTDVSSLICETELLKSNAEREVLHEILQSEKETGKYELQSLLTTQMEMISSFHDILNMNEDDAISHAKMVLGQLLESSTVAVTNIFNADEYFKVSEAAPPSKRGTPKRKKLFRLSKQPNMPAPIMHPFNVASVAAVAPPLTYSSPHKTLNRRKKSVVIKKNVSFTPKKKSPSKRSVRWRDDTESGILADFEKTPLKLALTPEASSTENHVVLPSMPTSSTTDVSKNIEDPLSSSPIPMVPVSSIDVKSKGRFQAGFLSRKSWGSPPDFTNQNVTLSSSDVEISPLRDIDPSNGGNRPSLNIMGPALFQSPPSDIGDNSGPENENSPHQINKSDCAKIGMTLKRSGSLSKNSRRKSPTAASIATSPSNENVQFTTSHARRMVPSQREPIPHPNVLSPRVAPIGKHNRRLTAEISSRHVSNTSLSSSGRLSHIGPGLGIIQKVRPELGEKVL